MEIASVTLPTISVPEPVCALMVWVEGGTPLVTRHTLELGAEGPRIGAGAALSAADAAALGELLNGRDGLAHSVLPADVLAISRDRLTWIMRATVRPMWFRFANRVPKRLDVPWPRLVLTATAGGLHLAAIKTRRRPTANTPLYHAPLMNVGADGALCLGNARMPDDVGLTSRTALAALVYDTAFSHVNHHRTLRVEDDVTSHRHFQFWRSLDGAARFPPGALRPMGIRLGTFLGRIAA